MKLAHSVCALALTLASCSSVAREANPPAIVYGAQAYIEADYDDVWRHLTTAEGFADWYTCPCEQFGTQPGDLLIWADAEREVYRGRLLSLRKGREVSWEFRFVGFGFEEPMAPVRIQVLERGPTVFVSIENDLSRAPNAAEIISPVGWAKPLSRLKTLLETGSSMAWPVDPGQEGPR